MKHSVMRRAGGLVLISAVLWSGERAGAAGEPSAASRELPASAEGKAAVEALAAAGYKFTPGVKAAYLNHAKALVRRELAASGRTLPEDFLTWVDGDPVVEATVYGARRDAVNVLWMLRSLELDLGKDTVRKDYTQLALAMAVVHSAKGPAADLSPREPLKLVIPGDPRKPVDTRDPKRTLDLNDHIINFLNENRIEEEIVVGHREEPAPLKYDDKGIAIPPPRNAKPVKVPITEKRTRTLYAADVIASRALQEKFNAYMKAHGQGVSIDCGDQVVSWKSTNAVHAERKKINEVFVMFRTAYEQKGLLPLARDPHPSPAEAAAFLIRNDKFVFPAETRDQRKWPRYPLNAPWPTLTLLAADNQPLREREERWAAFRDKGEMRTYGEYIGPIAQQFDMQSARRLSPHPFHYNTYQMMAKDGGVCGTMANMGVRTYNTLGIPSCTAGQPGHCALILFSHDPAKGLFECKGGQFATGGPEKTSPHTEWCFGDTDARKPMIYYQTVAWAVNHGFQGYLDSTLAWRMYRDLPASVRAGHGQALLEHGLTLDPWNILLVNEGQAGADTPEGQIRFWKAFSAALAAAEKPGCPKDALYQQVVKAGMFGRIAKLPPPGDIAIARAVLDFMKDEQCEDAEAIVTYQVRIGGMDMVIRHTRDGFSRYLASPRVEASSRMMAGTLTAVATRITDRKQRVKWAKECLAAMSGRESFLGPKNRIVTDPCVPALAKLSGTKVPPVPELQQPVLDQTTEELRRSVAGERTPKSCKQLADRIKALGGQVKEPDRLRKWAETMTTIIKGREVYQAKKGGRQTDPCAGVVATLADPKVKH